MFEGGALRLREQTLDRFCAYFGGGFVPERRLSVDLRCGGERGADADIMQAEQ